MKVKKRYLVIHTENSTYEPNHHILYKFRDVLYLINEQQDITDEDYDSSFEDIGIYDDYYIYDITDPDKVILITGLMTNETINGFLNEFDPELMYREGAKESLNIKKWD